MQRRDYPLVATKPTIRVRLAASDQSPVRQGVFIDTDGAPTLVVFVELETGNPVEITIHGARPVPCK